MCAERVAPDAWRVWCSDFAAPAHDNGRWWRSPAPAPDPRRAWRSPAPDPRRARRSPAPAPDSVRAALEAVVALVRAALEAAVAPDTGGASGSPAAAPDSAHGSVALDSAARAGMGGAPDSAYASVTLDSAGGAVARAAPDSSRVSVIAAGLARADSALAHADTTCARRNNAIPLSCVSLLARHDSTAARSLALIIGRKLIQHAPRMGPRVPRTRAEFLRTAFGPAALLRAGAIAGVEQLLGRPRWVPRSRLGYGARFGMVLGTNALAAGIRYETVRLLGVSPAAFAPCNCEGTGGRMAHALAAPFRAETTVGERFSVLTPLTELSSGMVFATVKGGFDPRQGLEAGLTGMLSLSAVALLQEFRPWEKWLRN